MRFFLLLLLFAQTSFAIPVGFNQAWFNNNYSGQYLDEYYDQAEVIRVLNLTQEAGAQNLRLWFFESPDFPMLLWSNDQIVGVKKDFILNVLRTLELAKARNVKVYMTFLDAHSYRPDKLNRRELQKLRSIYQQSGGQDFLNNVIAPFLTAIHSAGLSSTISRIDIANEMDTVVNRFGFNEGWNGANRMLCQWSSFIKNIDGFNSTPITFSLRLHPLLYLPWDLLSETGPMKCADFLDFHSYANSGKIHRCRALKRYSQTNQKPLILGEFGQSYFDHRYDDDLQESNTRNYLESANKCGFSEALAWRLSDIRPGRNKEARYSFEAFSSPRPAYQVIKEHNSSL
jgi:hypothetical protein